MKRNVARIVLSVVSVAACFATTDFRDVNANGNISFRSAEIAKQTTRTAELSSKLAAANSVEVDKARSELATLAAARFANLEALAEENPSQVLRFALPDDILKKIPGGLSAYFEKRETLEGEMEVIAECDETEGRTLYYLKASTGNRLSIHFPKEPDTDLLTGMHIRLKGVRVNDDVAPETFEKYTTAEIAQVAPNTFGEQKVLALLVNFQDDQRQPFTVGQADNLIFNTANSASVTNFYREASYQQTWLTGNSVGWLTLPINSGDCNGTTTASAAKQAATNAGIDLSAYNRFVYIYPKMPGCNYSGIAGVGGNEAWINGYLELRTIAHELGHNFGLYHARFMDCGAEAVGATCTTTEYGNMADIMGYPAITGNFNAFQKERLGWMNYGSSPPITTVQTSGTYFIAANAAQDTSPKALKIQKSNGNYYYVELRRPIGFDASLPGGQFNGLVVGLDQPALGKENYQLDMTPETSYWTDSPLPVGRSFTDPAAGITITPLSVDNSGAMISVTFGTQPTNCVLASPTVVVNPNSTDWIGAGGSASFILTLTNNNAAGCSANSFNIQSAAPSGWTTAASSSSLSSAPGATVSTNLLITPPASAADGNYIVTLGASNALNQNYSASATANVAVYSSLGVSLAADRTSYLSSQTANLTTRISAGGKAAAGANVSYLIKRPNGSVAASGTTLSGADGSATFSYRFNKRKDSPGTFQVSVTATLNNVSGSASTTFTLAK
jgi:hypothetical protein